MNPALYNATFTMALVAFSLVALFFGEMLFVPKIKSWWERRKREKRG
jgi:hypothetical protein